MSGPRRRLSIPTLAAAGALLVVIALQGVGTAQQPSCTRVEDQLTRANNDLTQCKGELRTAERDANGAQERRIEAVRAREKAEEEASQANSALVKLKDQYAAALSARQISENQNTELLTQIAKLERERDALGSDLENSKRQIVVLQGDLARATESNPDLHRRIQNLEGQLSDVRKSLDTATKQKDAAGQERQAAENAARSATGKLELAQRDGVALTNSLNVANRQLTDAAEDAKQVREKNQRLEVENDALARESKKWRDDLLATSRQITQQRDLLTTKGDELRTCETKVNACTSSGPAPAAALSECRSQLNVCKTSISPGPGTCTSELAVCRERVDILSGNTDQTSKSWRAIVEQDLDKRFADLRTSRGCETSFTYRVEVGELVLSGKLLAERARTVSDRAAEIARVLPSLRIRNQVEAIDLCPVVIDGIWQVEMMQGNKPSLKSYRELPDELGRTLPDENECAALGPKLEQLRLTSTAVALWARDDQDVIGPCLREGNRWFIDPTSKNRTRGLVLRKGNGQ